ncbi:MAG: hypothetical protein IPJ34_41430 [Myxococcales bacterium]|nr:hypothetical protein [Myxococcales bacterium]
MSEPSNERRAVLRAFVIALGGLCSAGSPCCGGTDIQQTHGIATVPFDAAVDGSIDRSACARACEVFQAQKGAYEGTYSCVAADAGVATADAGAGDGAAGDGGISVVCVFESNTCSQAAGRRPAGFREIAVRASTALGAHLSAMAVLEAASVAAFVALARDLEAHGAPRRLVRAARAAARDELRHAATMTRLAEEHGAVVPALLASAPAPRTLFELARDNAVEGCVGETFAALLATHEAAHAEPAELRPVLAAIARDETEHAVLAHEIHAWARTRLPARSFRHVRAAGLRARRALPTHTAPYALTDAVTRRELARALDAELPL